MNLTEKEYQTLADKAEELASVLSELGADSVVVMLSAQVDGLTNAYSARRGNYFASIAVAESWIHDQKDGIVPVEEEEQ